MKRLSQLVKLVDKNEDFAYFKILASSPDSADRDALTMLGFDGRETYFRVKLSNGSIEAVTFWYYGRAPENTITYNYTAQHADTKPIPVYIYRKVTEMLKEIGIL